MNRDDIEAREAVGSAAWDWTAVYEANASDLLRFLRRLVGDRHTAEDLLQDTFEDAMRARRRPDDVREARPWLYRIASNAALSHLRRRSALPLAAGERRVDLDLEEIDQVRTALRSIPAEQALTLTLVLHDGFSRREAAGILNVSEETVKSRLARGRLNFAAAYKRLERGLRG
jgi:RNA polymerase sigma-70 factor (ECF subfamily)